MILLYFIITQVLDFLTTYFWVLGGGEEGNPIARFLFTLAPTPTIGMVLLKLVAISYGVWLWKNNRQQVLVVLNYFFTAIVWWNLFWLTIRYL